MFWPSVAQHARLTRAEITYTDAFLSLHLVHPFPKVTLLIFVFADQGCNEEGQEGEQFPGLRITMGAPNECRGRQKVTKMSQVLSSMQYICFRNTSVSNMGAPNSVLAPYVI